MRIAYVTADHGIPVFGNKGASIHIQELVNAFSALGHDVTVLASRIGERSEAIRAPVVKVRCGPDARGRDTLPGETKALANERYRLAVGGAMQQAILRHHAAEPFDCLYERYSLWSTAGVRAGRSLGIPCLVEVNAPLLLEQRRYRELVLEDEAASVEAEVFSSADALIAVSEQVREYARARCDSIKRAVVVPNGVDPYRFRPQVEPARVAGVGEDAFVVGFVGSLKAWHDHEALLDAFAVLASRDPRFHLLIVGDGPTRDWIEGYVRGARLQGRVTVTGWVSYEELPALLTRADVAVAPYGRLEEFYFSPLKLFEYMAAGRPIVASAIGQVRDVIVDGTTGLLVEPGDVDGLVRAVERLFRDPRLRYSLGEEAVRSAQEYTWEKNAARTVEIAGSLLEAA